MIRFPIETPAKNFSSFPFIYLSLAFILGIVAAEFFKFPLSTALFAALSALIGAIFSVRKSARTATIFVLTAFSFGGAFAHLSAVQNVAPDNLSRLFAEGVLQSGQSVVVQGVLRREPEMTPDGWFLEISLEKIFDERENEISASGNVRIFVAVNDVLVKNIWNAKNLSYGAKIWCATRLKRDSSYQNQGVTPFETVLRQKNLAAVGVSRSPDSIRVTANLQSFAPSKLLYDWRQTLISEILRVFSPETAGVLVASLLGNDNFLSKQSAEKFRIGGTFHLLVISGTHITFIGISTLWLLRRVTKRNVWQFVGTLLVLWSYTFAVGAEIPVLRAALMFSVYQSARLFYRQGNTLNALGAAVLALAAWRTADVFTPSFQLTVFAVVAIVMFCFPLLEKLRDIGNWQLSQETPFPPNVAPSLRKFAEVLYLDELATRRSAKRNRWKAKFFRSETARRISLSGAQSLLQVLFSGLFVSAAVTIFLAPLLIIYFHRLSLVGLFLNFFVALILAAETFTAIFSLLVTQIFPLLAEPLIFLTEILNRLLTNAVEPFQYFAWISPRIPTYSRFGKIFYALYYLPILALIISVLRWNPFALVRPQKQLLLRLNALNLAVLTILFGVIFYHPWSAESAEGKLKIEFLDVGQGDAALVTFPDDTRLLIDGGGKPVFSQAKRGDEEPIFEPDTRSVGESVVSPFLWSKGLSEIDYVLATHADTDHIDGLNDVILNFKVKKALSARENVADADFERFNKTLRQRETSLQIIASGDVFRFGGAEMRVLSPTSENQPQSVYGNNQSLVLSITYGKHSFLLTGDIEREAEADLVLQESLPKFDVVKVPHHGSRTSSTEDFVNTTRPQFGVISVGKTSRYGHPHREVLERWQNIGTKLLTTGENGTITFMTNGETLFLQVFTNSEEYLVY